MSIDEIRVTATVRQIKDADLWDEYCELSGCSPWALNEGQIDPSESVTVPLAIVGQLMEWSQKQPKKGKFPKRTKMYLHGDKDSNWEDGEKLGLSESGHQGEILLRTL